MNLTPPEGEIDVVQRKDAREMLGRTADLKQRMGVVARWHGEAIQYCLDPITSLATDWSNSLSCTMIFFGSV